MPIKGLSEQLRMPRIGKIHLGVKKKNKNDVEYPSATDYFVCPPEVVKVFGEKPTSLPIMIPVEDEEYWASQYYRAYHQTRGLVCKGNGETCQRKVDTATGDMVKKDSDKVVWAEGTCEGRDCQMYQDKKCGEMMCLQFMLPDVPGVGVWQIDTGSINSIRNINSAAALIRSLCGRVKMLPLLLVLEKQEVVNPDDGKKKLVHVMNIRQRETLHSLLADSQKQVFELLAPPVDEAQAARDIEDYWPEKQEATPITPTKSTVASKEETSSIPPDNAELAQKVVEKLEKEEKTKVKNIQDFLGWVLSHGKQYSPTWLCRQLNINATAQITDIGLAEKTIREITGWND